MGACPFCAGQGERPEDDDDPTVMVKCDRCAGTGDLDEHRLVEAYKCGQRDATEALVAPLRDLQALLGVAIQQQEAEPLPASYQSIRQRIGG